MPEETCSPGGLEQKFLRLIDRLPSTAECQYYRIIQVITRLRQPLVHLFQNHLQGFDAPSLPGCVDASLSVKIKIRSVDAIDCQRLINRDRRAKKYNQRRKQPIRLNGHSFIEGKQFAH